MDAGKDSRRFIFGSNHLIKYCSQVSKDEKDLNLSEFEDFF
jgi:hypothetical protein